MAAIGTAYVPGLEQGAPEGRGNEARRAPAGWTGERCAPGRVGEQRVRESDGVRQPHAQRSLTREIGQRP